VGEFPLYDGASADALSERIGAEHVHLLDSTPSTMDVAHDLARGGAPSGTIVIADAQTAGRGRGGARWQSEPGQGIWMSLLERPTDPSAVDVLSLRAGLGAARALDLFVDEPVRIKWPNDLFSEGKKLGGILIEARWRDRDLEWVVIGLGVNVRQPSGIEAASLDPGTTRIEVLEELVPELRGAAAAKGILGEDEMAEFEGRDFARGKQCARPAIGVVKGISPTGELLVALADSVVKFRTGSLLLSDRAAGAGETGKAPVNFIQGSQVERHS
jgi:BirA family transcriptional regulator, biotin operon repressor / biotin---[acetyl-CoA-carboxylase] ligase